MVAPANSNHDNDQALINHFVDQPVAHITQFDFVGIL